MTFQSTTKEIVKTVLGITAAGGSLYLGYIALQQKPTDIHLVRYAAAGLLFGGILIAPEVVTDAGKKAVALIASLMTALKGGGSPPAP